ncbi:MAG: phosphoenolpyruvate carboxykinase (GTP) [Elusimicrobiota bacterium]
MATTPLEKWVEEQAALTKPDNVHWCDGSDEETRKLVETGLKKEKTGKHNTFYQLNPAFSPNSYLHRSHPSDVARTEHLTFINHPSKELAGPNNNWMEPSKAKGVVNKLFDGCMVGRTMYVMPYMMGPADSPYAKPCVQITDSVYVVISMKIMTRMGAFALKRIGSSDSFVKGLHSIGDLDPKKRYIMHFPDERLVMSIGSGYGGNALLGKKCFSLRIASYMGYIEGWLAEHMIVIGVEDPEGDIRYFLGAFPSACGKTNLALLAPTLKGYKVWTLGDDIAWINVGPDGRLYAINPETGFFCVAPGTSEKTNPMMIETLKNNKFYPTLFTNTGLDVRNNTPWWEGFTGEPPAELLDWQGDEYKLGKGKSGEEKPAAHPNSRFTVSIYNCPTLSKEFDNPIGVPISGIIFGGRRQRTVPLVYESFDWAHGVFLASIMGSETTTAATHQVGVVRRDPMAMLPFCGYNMAGYFRHWLNFRSKAKNLPKIFFVNWFRTDEDGNYLWPGFRENCRILKWMVDRIKKSGEAPRGGAGATGGRAAVAAGSGAAGAKETPLGFIPDASDIDLSGGGIDGNKLKDALRINRGEWQKEIEDVEKFYSQFGEALPQELKNHLEKLKKSI